MFETNAGESEWRDGAFLLSRKSVSKKLFWCCRGGLTVFALLLFFLLAFRALLCVCSFTRPLRMFEKNAFTTSLNIF